MKKSNLILLSGFLAVVLLISAIHITLYAKYKAGDYTVYNVKDDLTPPPMQLYPNILFVSVQNVPAVAVKFTGAAEAEKEKEEGIECVQKGDTLLVTGRKGMERDRTLVLNLPFDVTLSAVNSRLYFDGGKTPDQKGPAIFLKESRAVFSGEEDRLELDYLKLVATDNSSVSFQGHAQINHLDLKLSQSTVEDAEGNFGQLSVETDSVSHLAFQPKHLVKASVKLTGTN